MLIGVGRKQSARPTHRSGLRLSERYESAEFAAILDTPYARSIGKRQIALEPGSVPAVSIGARGPQLSFSGTQYLTTPSIGVGAEFTVLVGQTPRASNNGYDRMVETDYANSWFLGCNSSGANYCWIVNNASLEGCIGGSPTIGTRDLVVGTFAGSTRTLYVNGNQVASASATAPTPANRAMAIARQASGAAGYWEGEFDLLVVLPFAITAAEVRAIYEDEIGVLFAPRRIWVQVSAGGGSVSLIVADATHAHTADGLVLTSSTALSVADATHAHAADAITLVVGSVLTVAEASHAHAADSPALTAASALAVADATHSHAADNITLSVAGATNLTVADALHGHAADALALTSAHALIVADATHGHTVDGLTLTAASVLAIQEALHAHAADNITLDASGAVNLLLADGLHAHTADGVALTVAAWLTVADALHGHAADNVVLTFGGAVVEPLARYTIAAKARRLTITAAARRLEIRK